MQQVSTAGGRVHLTLATTRVHIHLLQSYYNSTSIPVQRTRWYATVIHNRRSQLTSPKMLRCRTRGVVWETKWICVNARKIKASAHRGTCFCRRQWGTEERIAGGFLLCSRGATNGGRFSREAGLDPTQLQVLLCMQGVRLLRSQ